MGGSQPAQVGVQGEGDLLSDAEGLIGRELSFGAASESASVAGLAMNGSQAGLSLQLGGVGDLMPSDSSLAQNFSGGLEVLAKSWTRQGQSSPYRDEVLYTLSFGAGIQIAIPGWGQYDPEHCSGLMSGISRKRSRRRMAARWSATKGQCTQHSRLP